MVFSLGLPKDSHFLYGIFQYILLKISALKDNLSHKDDYFRLKSFEVLSRLLKDMKMFTISFKGHTIFMKKLPLTTGIFRNHTIESDFRAFINTDKKKYLL